MTKAEIKKARTALAQQVIEYLNDQAGRNFDFESRGTLKLFTAEWSHRYGLKQYKGVIDYLVLKWKDDPVMVSYLRPKTLFGPEKFSEYLEEARALMKAEIYKKRLQPFINYSPAEITNNGRLTDFKNYEPTIGL